MPVPMIANIPTWFEKGAHNAIESYRLQPDGRIATTFTYREGGFDGEAKAMHPLGRVLDARTNAVWGMQFIWPIEADYRIAHVDEGYTVTVVAREKRDYVWIMARTPSIPEDEYARLVTFVASQGYDVAKLRRVPQRWPVPVDSTRP